MSNEITTMQTRVLLQLVDDGYSSLRTYSSIPAMAGVVRSNKALDQLALNPNVRKVDLDVGGSGDMLAIEWFWKQTLPTRTGDTESSVVSSNSISHIGADKRHDQCNLGDGITIAVLDSGVDSNHVNLLHSSIKAEACFADNGQVGKCPDGSSFQIGKGAAADDAGHGTFVTGVLSSQGTKGDVGVAPDANIVAVKVTYGPNFNGVFSSFDQILAGLDYILSNPQLGVNIINMSIGTHARFAGDCDNVASWAMAAADAIQTLRSQGIVAFASAGNGSSDGMTAPACLSGVIAVGASDKNDKAASFTDSNASTDMFAPGVSIESSTLDNGMAVQSGTSFASPHAAGCAALLMESGEALTPLEVEDRLKTSSSTVTRDGITFPIIDCSPPLSNLNDDEATSCTKRGKKIRHLRG